MELHRGYCISLCLSVPSLCLSVLPFMLECKLVISKLDKLPDNIGKLEKKFEYFNAL
jgi:hypothetical protein